MAIIYVSLRTGTRKHMIPSFDGNLPGISRSPPYEPTSAYSALLGLSRRHIRRSVCCAGLRTSTRTPLDSILSRRGCSDSSSYRHGTMSPPRRALIAVTSAHAKLFQAKETTGLFISEALHPFKVFRDAGFEVDLSSETGTYVPDWLSQQPDFLNGETLAIWNDVNSEFRRKLDNMPKAAELDATKYGVFYASAGHAALIDYPTAVDLQKVASHVWTTGGIVASVCHGPAIFVNVVDLKSGEPIIKGRTITGFTSEAEETMGIMPELKSWKSPLVEDVAKALGATWESQHQTCALHPLTDMQNRQACARHLGRLSYRRRPPDHRSEPRQRGFNRASCCGCL
jgi:putative intracellular protease/amidase